MDKVIDFNAIVLSKLEKKALRKLNKNVLVPLSDEIIRYFLNYDLIRVNEVGRDSDGFPIHDNLCSLTDVGKKFYLYRKTIFNTKLFEWIRYGITTVIAITALVISIAK